MNNFITDPKVQILMLKGQNGATYDDTELRQLIAQKANISDIPTDLSELSNATTKFVNETQLNNAISSLGSVFTLKGSVATASSLPSSNNSVGDVYYVEDESAGYVWINDNGTLRWEQLGLTVDTTNFVNKTDIDTSISSSSTNNKVASAKAVYDLFNSITDGDGVSY